MRPMIPISRRQLLLGAALASAAGACGFSPMAGATGTAGVRPFPLSAVRLKPSIYSRAVAANLGYLRRLDPDRLLHDFRLQAASRPEASPTAVGRGKQLPATRSAITSAPAP